MTTWCPPEVTVSTTFLPPDCPRLQSWSVLLLLSMFLPVAGCSQAGKRMFSLHSAQENYRLALPEDLSASHADERRSAVARIAESGYVTSEEAFHVLDAVARTDPQPQIRCIAIRAFARYKDSRPVPTLLIILQADRNSDKALLADADVRWEAVTAVVDLQRRGFLAEEHKSSAREVLIRLLESDGSRNVRLRAAEGLGGIHDRLVFPPLIRCLRAKDFALADRAEHALIALTGVTHHYDADAWEKWLAETPDPFAHAGAKVEGLTPKKPGFLDSKMREMRQFLKLGNAD